MFVILHCNITFQKTMWYNLLRWCFAHLYLIHIDYGLNTNGTIETPITLYNNPQNLSRSSKVPVSDLFLFSSMLDHHFVFSHFIFSPEFTTCPLLDHGCFGGFINVVKKEALFRFASFHIRAIPHPLSSPAMNFTNLELLPIECCVFPSYSTIIFCSIRSLDSSQVSHGWLIKAVGTPEGRYRKKNQFLLLNTFP